MIRRLIIAMAFVLAGFASLLVSNVTYTWTCNHFPNLCKVYTGPCPGIDACTPDTVRSMMFFAVYFGPSILFGIVGFVFSKETRSLWAWLRLLLGLVVLHSVVMFFGIQLTTG